jgi:hypothetical protein
MAAGALPPLVELLRSSSDEGKAKAAGALWNLAIVNKAAVAEVGALPPLVELLRGGSDEGRANAAGVLRSLTSGNDTDKAAVVAAGALLPLVELLRNGGSAMGRRFAAGGLYNLTFHDAGRRQV